MVDNGSDLRCWRGSEVLQIDDNCFAMMFII